MILLGQSITSTTSANIIAVDNGGRVVCAPQPVAVVRCESAAPVREPVPAWLGPAYAGGGALLTAILFAALTRWTR